MDDDARIAHWVSRLERRHLASLTFPEVRRALQALSSTYVERRDRIASGAPLEGNGKRAAFALYYGVQHLLLAREIALALGAHRPPPRRILDLGCGTGSGGAGWALAAGSASAVEGVDRSGWAVSEARQTLGELKLRGQARTGDAARTELTGFDAVVAAWSVNELPEPDQQSLLARLLEAQARGTRVLVLEPLARRTRAWLPRWEEAFAAAGGRSDEWRLPVELPELTAKLGHAAGLDTRLLTARSLWLGGRDTGAPSASGPRGADRPAG